jgi:hypothetical protein
MQAKDINLKGIIVFAGIFLMLASCNDKQHSIKIPEEVCNKASQLKRQFFNSIDRNSCTDSLKIEAASFLFKNILYHTHQEGVRTEVYKKTILEAPLQPWAQEQRLKQLGNQFRYDQDSLRFDVFQFPGNKITEHIDNVIDFNSKTAWHKKVPVSIFCNYLLPYNIDIEASDNWTKYFREAYFESHDSSYIHRDIKEAIRLIHLWIYKRTLGFDVKWGQNALNLPQLSPVVLDHLRVGSCQQLTTRSTAMMRALGIPASVDFTPSYLNRGIGHSWCAAIIDSSEYIPFDATTKELYVYRNNSYTIPKVYRRIFALQKNSHLLHRGYCPFLPRWLNSPFYKDVTCLYTKTSNLNIPVNEKLIPLQKTAYLCVFSRQGWIPVAWGRTKNQKAVFEQTGRGGVYLPMQINASSKKALAPPFLLNDSGGIHFLKPDTLNGITLNLKRKFPLDKRKALFIERMVGGWFEGTNSKNFKNAEKLAVIDSFPGEYFNEIKIKTDKKFRFVRYVAPKKSFGNIAELEFYGKKAPTQILKGKIRGTDGTWNNNSQTTKNAAFDGDPLTYVDTKQPDNAWVGLDLGRLTTISRIRFIARTDMNAIQKGDEYELFYWDDLWISLGRQTANGHELIYREAPSNALFWLRNNSEGKEERIFTYEQGKQIWW